MIDARKPGVAVPSWPHLPQSINTELLNRFDLHWQFHHVILFVRRVDFRDSPSGCTAEGFKHWVDARLVLLVNAKQLIILRTSSMNSVAKNRATAKAQMGSITIGNLSEVRCLSLMSSFDAFLRCLSSFATCEDLQTFIATSNESVNWILSFELYDRIWNLRASLTTGAFKLKLSTWRLKLERPELQILLESF